MFPALSELKTERSGRSQHLLAAGCQSDRRGRMQQQERMRSNVLAGVTSTKTPFKPTPQDKQHQSILALQAPPKHSDFSIQFIRRNLNQLHLLWGNWKHKMKGRQKHRRPDLE